MWFTQVYTIVHEERQIPGCPVLDCFMVLTQWILVIDQGIDFKR